jgi:hypothetical protein
MAAGHPEARDYPLGLLFDEAELVSERKNHDMATIALLTDLAISKQPNQMVKHQSTAKTARRFNDLIKKLTGG